MKYCIKVITFLFILSPLCVHSYSNGTFSKDTTIAHPETGLFLDYVGLYTPSENIIHNSAVFSMTTATCHFLPLSAAENIPSCNITRKRNKRFIENLMGVISVAAGAASLGMSVSNTIQIGNLQQQVALVEDTLSKFSRTMEMYGAKLVNIASKHIELSAELVSTQKALDAIVPVLDTHSAAINTLKTGLEQLQVQIQHLGSDSTYISYKSYIFKRSYNLSYIALVFPVFPILHRK